MRCTDVRDRLSGDEPLSEEALAHVGECEACAGVDLSVGDLDEVRTSIMDEIARRPGVRERLRSLPTAARVGAVAALIAGLGAFVGLASRRPDLASYPIARWVLELGALVALVGYALNAGLRSAGRPPEPAARERTAGIALLALPLVLVAMPRSHAAHEASVIHGPGELGSTVAACLAYGSAFGTAALAALWATSRGEVGVPLGRAMMAIAGGAVGLLVLHLHCPITDQAHIFLGHAVLPALFAAAAYLTVRVRRAPT